MKYFTIDWWAGIQEFDITDPSGDYAAYLTAIRDRLPKDLLALQESISLHDAHLRELHYSGEVGLLDIRLDGDDERGKLRRFHLQYSGVVSFGANSDPDKSLIGPGGFGDWGYDEADLAEDGRFEHRVLFSSGIELQIVFEGLTVSWEAGEPAS